MSAPGYLTPAELTTVQPGVELANAVARNFLAMRDAAAEEDHVNVTIALPAGGYRSHALDVDMHTHPQKYNINPALTSGLYPVGVSKHALGTEVDIVAGLAWVIKNGARFGFTRTEVAKGDLNHFHGDGTTVVAVTATPITEQREDDDMPHIMIEDKTNSQWLVGTNARYHLTPDDAALWSRWEKHDPKDRFNTAQMDRIIVLQSTVNK